MTEFSEKPNGKKIIEMRAQENMKKVCHLYDLGYSYRQIKEELNFKSVTSVVYYLDKRKNK